MCLLVMVAVIAGVAVLDVFVSNDGGDSRSSGITLM